MELMSPLDLFHFIGIGFEIVSDMDSLYDLHLQGFRALPARHLRCLSVKLRLMQPAYRVLFCEARELAYRFHSVRRSRNAH